MYNGFIAFIIVAIMILVAYYYWNEQFDMRHHQLIQRGLNTSNTDIDASIYLLDGLEKTY